MEWTDKTPNEQGIFAYKIHGQWLLYIGHVKKGDWQLTQNPELLYIHGESVSDIDGKWYGPIDEPK